MADPITLALTTVKVGLSLATFLEKRRVRQAIESQASDSPRYRRDVFLVVGNLGNCLLPLEIVNKSALDMARTHVRGALRVKDSPFMSVFDDELEEPLQYAVTVGMFFCAECWPMPIYRGFGHGVMNDKFWGSKTLVISYDPWVKENPQEPANREFDECISQLKMTVRSVKLFTSVPDALTSISFHLGDHANEKNKKKATSWLRDVFAESTKKGLPQPKDSSFTTTEVKIIHSDFHSKQVFKNLWGASVDDLYYPMRTYRDPGRLLYAYLVANQIELQRGQMIMPIDRVEYVLLRWLESLPTTTFKLISDDELDEKHPKFKRKCRWVMEFDTPSTNFVAVCDEQKIQAIARAKQEVNNPKPAARRPAPTPPTSSLRTVQAKHNFAGESAGELSFKMGDILEVIEEVQEDGWMKARLRGKEGDIPASFVKNV